MKWTKLTIKTTTEAIDLVSDMLSELGIEGIEIVDNVPLSEEDKQKMFIDILPELSEDDGTAMISCYVDVADDTNEMVKKIQAGLEELSVFISVGSGEITVSETEDKDWINNWKEFFKPFRVDDTIVIKPTWEQLTDSKETDMVIEIDPGTAFGTGSHETTKLCILNLKKYLKKGQHLLDVGCGSGILSIIGMKLGAKSCVATDIDPIAVTTSAENAQVNHVVLNESEENLRGAGELTVLCGDIISDDEFRKKIGINSYEIVVANILADVIIPLSSVIGQCLTDDGIFISSGIINTKENAVRAALETNGFEIVEVLPMKDWVSIVAKKRAA